MKSFLRICEIFKVQSPFYGVVLTIKSYNKVRAVDELSETLVAEEREDLSFVWDAVKMLPAK